MDEPAVSIVINNYNYGAFLSDAIESALAQTYPNSEVIVVDDGSTDNSRDIINGYASQNKITPVLKNNGGQASALNAGFVRSKGAFVLFLDSDDYLASEAVETMVERLRHHPDVSKGQFRLEAVDVNGSSLRFIIPAHISQGPDLIRQELLRIGCYDSPPTSGNIFSRGFLQQVMPIPESDYQISADGYLITLAPLYGAVLSIDLVLGFYRIHGANAWSSADPNRFVQYIEHDLTKVKLLASAAEAKGLHLNVNDILHANPNHMAARLAASKLGLHSGAFGREPVLRCLLPLMHSVIKSNLPFRSRAFWLSWTLLVGALPKRLARLVIPWLFQPYSRPRLLRALRDGSHQSGLRP